MRMKFLLLTLLFNTFVLLNTFGQKIPLVYEVENTGVDCTKPPLPVISELPVVEPLTDPFEWSDRSGRSTNFIDWTRRRAEIAEEIQHYEIGIKPPRPDTITASYSGGILTVNVTENGKTLVLTSQITLPAGTGPFPAIIGMNSGTGSLPSSIFTSRNIVTIPYSHNQVVTYGGKNASDPYYKLYPDLFYTGQYSSWVWGVSRLIDGLELVQDDLPVDLKRLAVTGCSYAGKMSLFAGALDERIALTIPQESGGGGAAAWRVSNTLSGVETLSSTSSVWFMTTMFQFGGPNVSKLPMDHHELLAMVAPRALLVFGNPDYLWLADPSGFVSCKAAQRVWETFGVPDRFGFSIVGGHGHCSLPASQYPELEAFVDKFLLGDTTVNTQVEKHPYELVDHSRWTKWWGTDNPVFPDRDAEGTESLWFEAECASVGKNWLVQKVASASNKAVVTIKPGMNSTVTAPTDTADFIYFPFSVTADTTYYLFVNTLGATNNDDSYWIKVDDGDFVKYEGLTTNSYEWRKITGYDLTPGVHTLTVAYCEDGALLDKLCISSNMYLPVGKADTAENVCDPAQGTETVWLEAECATTGSDWNIVSDSTASNEAFVTIKPGLNSISSAPTDSAGTIYIPFSVTQDKTYYVYARMNASNADNDLFWIKMDDADYIKVEGIVTRYKWKQLFNYDLTPGTHTLAVAYGDDGVKIDKFCISNNTYNPLENEDTAVNICDPLITPVSGLEDVMDESGVYKLGQNYPNPFNGKTSISFEIAKHTFVSLKIYNTLGVEVAELAGKKYPEGKHTVEFNSDNLSEGIYYYTIKADKFTAGRKLILQTR